MYFSFPGGQIRHISKILPELIEDNHTIAITENTRGVPRRQRGMGGWHTFPGQGKTADRQVRLVSGGPGRRHQDDRMRHEPGHGTHVRRYSVRLPPRRVPGTRPSSCSPRPGHWFDHEEQSTYTFTLRVKDIDGDTDSLTVNVEIEDVDETPASPAPPILSGVEQQAITISWTAPATLTHGAQFRTALDTITGYRVEYTPDGIPGESITLDIGDPLTLSTTVDGLYTNTRYNVRVLAVNGHGEGKWSPFTSTSTLVNPAPTLTPTVFETAENTPLDPDRVHIALLEAQDVDDSITGYEILTLGPDHGQFELDFHLEDVLKQQADPPDPSVILKPAGSADLYLKHILDYENQTEYQLSIRINSGEDRRLESATFQLTVTVTDVDEPPVQPDPPATSHILQKSLRATWTPPATTGPPIKDYDVEYRKQTDTGWKARTHEGTALYTNLTNLARHTGYEVRVLARNDEGDSPWSEPTRVTTSANIPPEITGGDMTLQRNVDENTPGNEPIGGPILATDPDIDEDGAFAYSLKGTDAAQFTIDEATGQVRTKAALDHETMSTHSVIVRVEDGQTGHDEADLTITVDDLDEKPDRPDAPTVTDVPGTTNALTASWTEPANGGPPISNYQVRQREDGTTEWDRIPQAQASTDTSRIITGLGTNTTYQVQVRAYNDELWSDWSPSGEGTTPDNNPPVFAERPQADRSIAENIGDGRGQQPQDHRRPGVSNRPGRLGHTHLLPRPKRARQRRPELLHQRGYRAAQHYHDHQLRPRRQEHPHLQGGRQRRPLHPPRQHRDHGGRRDHRQLRAAPEAGPAGSREHREIPVRRDVGSPGQHRPPRPHRLPAGPPTRNRSRCR